MDTNLASVHKAIVASILKALGKTKTKTKEEKFG
jgi:hypothetical protein